MECRIDSGDKQDFNAIHDALYAAKLCSYAQGMNLIRAGSEEYHWDINLREMARIWKAGCIIRARFLDEIMQAYERQPATAESAARRRVPVDVTGGATAWRQCDRQRRRAGHSACPRCRPRWPTSTAIARRSCRRISPRRSATTSERTRISARSSERGFVHTDWQKPGAQTATTGVPETSR